jgi:translation initiation factor 1
MSKKIPVSAAQAPLQNPFASLNPEAFPESSEPDPGASKATSPRPVAPRAARPRIVLRREKARRGGKTVVVASGFPTHLSVQELEALCKKARKALGCGGTLGGREIELQGDNPDRVRAFFEDGGFAVAGPG